MQGLANGVDRGPAAGDKAAMISPGTKRAARSRARRYLQRGIIDRRGCGVCGAPAEMHHVDYERPWLVDWLCRPHHELAHHRADVPGQLVLWLGA